MAQDCVQTTVERMLKNLCGPSLPCAAIWLPAERLYMLAELDVPEPSARRPENEPAPNSPLALALAEGAPAYLVSAPGEPGYPAELGQAPALIAAPLRLGGATLGALALGGQPAEWPARTVELLARQMAVAVQAARDCAQANEGRIQFVSSVSHELRTPMTAIKGYTDMLLAGMAGEMAEPQRKFLSIVKANADRLGALISDLLEVSRLEAGRTRLNLTLVPLGELVQQAIAALQGQIAAKKLGCEIAIPDALPPVRGDRVRLAQIMAILLGNACRYTPEGGNIRIAAVLCRKEQGASCVQVDIADTGIGIAPEEQPKVFQRFFRADHPLVREQPGAGLGLCIARGLVELHGGRIWFRSEPEQGTTFSFTLPLAADEPAAG
ncbi:MAG: GAF domain-containing sensor histidine kinase [Chloroflexi bacterium]|nr:GAF domain-containing sensor histidine kinase [Chloroflexota bacterium]